MNIFCSSIFIGASLAPECLQFNWQRLQKSSGMLVSHLQQKDSLPLTLTTTEEPLKKKMRKKLMNLSILWGSPGQSPQASTSPTHLCVNSAGCEELATETLQAPPRTNSHPEDEVVARWGQLLSTHQLLEPRCFSRMAAPASITTCTLPRKVAIDKWSTSCRLKGKLRLRKATRNHALN